MNPERLIGSLIVGGLGRRMPGRARAAVGMGLLGVAIAAFEHYSQQHQSGAAPPPPPGGGPVPPPPPPGVPIPPAATDERPETAGTEQEAILLVQAMAAAAWADGVLDVDERERIIARAKSAGLAADELELVATTLEHPPGAKAIVASVSSPELAEQVYGASLLAIAVDSAAERTYLGDLASRLGLAPETVARIHRLLGAPPPA